MVSTSEEVLQAAYELGRHAWSQGIGVVQLAGMQHEALAEVLARLSTPAQVGQATRSAAMLAAECLSVFEMAMRGYQEANAVLAEANRKLEAANEELDAFSYSVSHDLQAPLRAINGFSHMLLDDCAPQMDATAQDHLRRVCAAAQRMGELIDDLLHLSRVGRMELTPIRLDLSRLAAEVGGELRRREPDRQVELAIEQGLSVEADPRLMRIVLENLLGNAWKFTARTSSARIEVGRTVHDGDEIYFVRDNGPGFDMRFANKLFRPFQRLHTESDFPGTGIGLATVRRIIDRHDGRIWADATIDRGAAFYFTIPSRASRNGGA